jgi:hypothetical protein
MKWLNNHIGKLATDLVAEQLHQMYMKELIREFNLNIEIEIENDFKTTLVFFSKPFWSGGSKGDWEFKEVCWEYKPDTCFGPRLDCCSNNKMNCAIVEDDLGLTFPEPI